MDSFVRMRHIVDERDNECVLWFLNSPKQCVDLFLDFKTEFDNYFYFNLPKLHDYSSKYIQGAFRTGYEIDLKIYT